MLPLAEFQNFLTERKSEGLFRQLPIVNNDLVDLSSNDYLGLSKHPALAQAASKAAFEYGCGSTGSRLLSGNSPIFEQTEQMLGAWKGHAKALYFSNGYAANVGLVTALATPGTHLFLDRLAHASLYDGARMAGAPIHRFLHNDANDLHRQLQRYPGKGLILVESVYSMDGDQAPLREFAQLAKDFAVGLVVDEAHADGVQGIQGRGLVHALGLEHDVDVVMGTLGKAMGASGAAIWAQPVILDWLINYARPWIYSTANSPMVLGAVQASIKLMETEAWRKDRVLELAQILRNSLQAQGFDTLQSTTQIVPVLMGQSQRALAASQFLATRGFKVPAIRPPTVPADSARLRINLTALHQEEHIHQLVQSLVQWRDQT